MTTETRRRLRDALRSCVAIGRYTAGLDLAAYERDEMVRDAVERRLGIIGEALNRAASLEPALAAQLPELRQVVGLRNRVIHGYDDANAEIVWSVVAHMVPSLQSRLAVSSTRKPRLDVGSHREITRQPIANKQLHPRLHPLPRLRSARAPFERRPGRGLPAGFVGAMLERFLVIGQSITDACMGWDMTVSVLLQLAAAVRARRDVCANRERQGSTAHTV